MCEIVRCARASVLGCILAFVGATLSSPRVGAQATDGAANEANNPLTPKITVNFQD